MHKKLRIAYLITRSDAIAGAQVHLFDLCMSALLDGNTVVVICGQKGPFFDLLSNNGVCCVGVKHLIRPVSPINDFIALIQIIIELWKFKPDILSLHSTKAGILGRIAGWFLQIPTVFTAHGWAFSEGVTPIFRLIYKIVERIFASLAMRIITVSKYDMQLAIKENVVCPDRLITIHNGASKIQNSFIANPMISPPRLIMVARFDIPKEQERLILALFKLKEIAWELDLVGDGPQMNKSQALAKHLGIENRISFHGACNNIPELISKCQIFILISNYEGFPRSIIEGMRAGLPVIASNVGGCGEAVIDGKTGFLIPRGDNEVLIDKLHRLLVNPELRTSMGNAGRIRYNKEFTLETMYQKTITVYNSMLKCQTK